MIVPMTKADEWHWYRSRSLAAMTQDMKGFVAYQKGKIAAAASFTNFSGHSCIIGIAIDNPFVIRHGFLNRIFEYAFIERGVEQVCGFIPESNHKSFKFAKNVGLKEIARIPEMFAPGVGYIVVAFSRDECRWLPESKERKVA